MKPYTIYLPATGQIISSGISAIDADSDTQPVPDGAALLSGVASDPARQKIVDGEPVDIAP